jgi:hypothetical protein
MTRQSSKGKCSFCGGSFAKAAMARHLKACNARAEGNDELAAKGSARRTIFHLQVQGLYQPMYWMHIEIPENATLKDLDDFLRETWLECCGHLSSFEIEGCTFISEKIEPGDRSMRIALGKAIAPGTKFEHIYDFGTSTELSLKVLSSREGLARGMIHPISDARAAANQPPRFAASASTRAPVGSARSVLESTSAERICSCPWSTLPESECAATLARPMSKTADELWLKQSHQFLGDDPIACLVGMIQARQDQRAQRHSLAHTLHPGTVNIRKPDIHFPRHALDGLIVIQDQLVVGRRLQGLR